MQSRQHLKDFVYVFTFLHVSNAGILIIIFISCFQSHICECFNFSGCNFNINMNKSVKYLLGIKFLQLTLVKKTEFKNLGHPSPNLVSSQ
jgi:hypothetical protein